MPTDIEHSRSARPKRGFGARSCGHAVWAIAPLLLLGWNAAASADAPVPVPPPVIVAPATPPQKPADPAALASAKKLLSMLHVDQTIDRLMSQLTPMMTTGVLGMLEHGDATQAAMQKIESRPNGRDRLMVIFSEEILKSFRARYPTILDGAAQEYATVFTKRELDEAIAFYSTGTGAKFLALAPQLQQAVGMRAGVIGREAGMEAGQRAMQRAIQELLPSEKTSL